MGGGNIDKKEILTWHHSFLRDYPNGFIGKEQFLSLYEHFFPFGDARPFASLFFTLYDVDGSNSIDFGEYLSALSITSRGSVEEKIQWAFRLYDRDGDGFISKDDLGIVVEAVYKMVGPMCSSFPEDEQNYEQRVDKIMSKITTRSVDDDGRAFTLEEFRETAKAEPSMIHSLFLYDGVA